MNVLIVVDMQNDFIDGALGSAQAVAIVPNAAKKIQAYRRNGGLIVFTRDTHGADYLQTQEGQKLPVPHCIENTSGWEISDALPVENAPVVNKKTFGSVDLPDVILRQLQNHGASMPDAIELIGLCTDICVISNALLLKARFPEVPIQVDASCCAGVTPASHLTALNAMKMCQIDILNEED